MPTYDPLALLERANAHAQQWQSALDAAIARQSTMTNTAYADGFARDRVFQLYPSELDRMQAGNTYQAQLAQSQTRLLPEQEQAQRSAYRLDTRRQAQALQELQWTDSPENTMARRTVIDDRLQSPAAQLRAGAATYGRVDPMQREAAIRDTLTNAPGALSAQANAAAPYANTVVGQSIDRLLLGESGAADALLQQAGLGRVIAQPDGRLVLVDAQGQSSAPLTAQEAAVALQSRTAQPGTPLQAYGAAQTQAAQAAWLKRLEQQAERAQEDAQAARSLRLELFKAAADPMATPESRQALEGLAQRFGIDVRGGAAAATTPSGLPSNIAEAAGMGPTTSAFGAVTGLGAAMPATPPAVTRAAMPETPARTVTSPTSEASRRASDGANANLPRTFDDARRDHDAARAELTTLLDRRTAMREGLARLERDIAAAGGRMTAYGVMGDGETLGALRSAHERLREEQSQLDAAIRIAQTRTQQSTRQLRRLTRERQDAGVRDAKAARAQAAYEAYRP